MKSYVLGFAFDMFGQVLLKRAQRPAHLAGYLNGLGGAVEGDETPIAAMVREFREESGIETDESNWTRFGAMVCNGCLIHLYAGQVVDFGGATDSSEGHVYIAEVEQLPRDVVPNLRWLVPMARCPKVDSVQVEVRP